jgi:hypothetical protein
MSKRARNFNRGFPAKVRGILRHISGGEEGKLKTTLSHPQNHVLNVIEQGLI